MRRFRQPYWFMADPALDMGGGDPAPSDPPADPPADPPSDPVAGVWPDNWREAYAGEDEAKLAKLARYQSPNAALDALFSAQQKISSGEYKSAAPFPVDGSDEEKQAWRESNGIPLKPDEYGIQAIDDDKDFVAAVAQFAHENNMPKEHAQAVYKFLTEQEQAELAEEAEADARLKQKTEDELRAEMGGDYRRNINLVNGMLAQAPEGVKDMLFEARDSEGRPIGSNANVIRWLTDLALQINPVATLINPAGNNVASTVDDQIKEIEGWMRAPSGSADHGKYWKDESVQKRYRDLIAYKERQGSK